MTMWLGVVFAMVCFGVAVKGFMSLPEITDAKAVADAQGFAWFWAFLGAVAVVFSAVSWWIVRNDKGDQG